VKKKKKKKAYSERSCLRSFALSIGYPQQSFISLALLIRHLRLAARIPANTYIGLPGKTLKKKKKKKHKEKKKGGRGGARENRY
jgi:hypothetical protein